jgi:hypothetical protein
VTGFSEIAKFSAVTPRKIGNAEAVCRAELALQLAPNHWRVPANLPERGQAYDLARDRANIRISILSLQDLNSQIGHDGATWLDRELVSRQRIVLADEGFGQLVGPTQLAGGRFAMIEGLTGDGGLGLCLNYWNQRHRDFVSDEFWVV